MESNKFEDSIKEKLEKRTLEPSGNAWNTLSERLDAQVEKSNNKSYWWLGLAASVIGILFVVSNVMDSDMKLEDTQEVVGTTDENQQNEAVNVENNAANEYVVTPSEKAITTEAEVNTQKPKSENILNSVIKEETVAASVHEKPDSEEKDIKVAHVEIINESLTFEEQKIQDVVAQVQTLKAENKTLTNADVEALLVEAQKEIALNRLFNDTEGRVDANALLQGVEDELDQSFRSKVFEAIKASYNTVKTTVAQRNK